MSKYRNWGNYKNKDVHYDDTHINDKDISIFNNFSQEPAAEQIQLTEDTSIMLISNQEEVGYAIIYQGNVLEANVVNSEEEIQEMLNKRDIAIGTIISSDKEITTPEGLLHEEQTFTHDAESEPTYISNEYLPQGCEIMIVRDDASDEFTASIIKNGYIVDSVSSENIDNTYTFAENVAQAAVDSSAIDPRNDHDNIKAAEALKADYYLIDLIEDKIEAMKARYELNQEYEEKEEAYVDALSKVDDIKNECGPKCHHDLAEKTIEDSSETPIEVDGDKDSEYTNPAKASDYSNLEFGTSEENQLEDDGPVLSRFNNKN